MAFAGFGSAGDRLFLDRRSNRLGRGLSGARRLHGWLLRRQRLNLRCRAHGARAGVLKRKLYFFLAVFFGQTFDEILRFLPECHRHLQTHVLRDTAAETDAIVEQRVPGRIVGLQLADIGVDLLEFGRGQPHPIAGGDVFLFEIAVAGAGLGRNGDQVSDRPIEQTAIEAVFGIARRMQPGDSAGDDLISAVHAAIQHVQVAVVGGSASAEFDEIGPARMALARAGLHDPFFFGSGLRICGPGLNRQDNRCDGDADETTD